MECSPERLFTSGDTGKPLPFALPAKIDDQWLDLQKKLAEPLLKSNGRLADFV